MSPGLLAVAGAAPAVLGFQGGNIFYVLGQVYVVILVLRALLSWIPMSAESALAPVARVIYYLTEPVLRPFRRIIPPVGGFDLSFLVAFFLVELFVSMVLQRL